MKNDELELKKLELQQELLEQKQEIEKAKYPNSMENIKSRVDASSWSILLFGYFGFCCFLGAIACLSEGNIIAVPFLGFAGIKLLQEAQKANVRKERYMKYISLIIVQDERSIDKIATELQTDYDTALKDITFIIANGFIKDFKVNKETKMIEYNRNTIKNKYNDTNQTENAIETNVRRCPACGGTRLIKKSNGIYCKYCGTRL